MKKAAEDQLEKDAVVARAASLEAERDAAIKKAALIEAQLLAFQNSDPTAANKFQLKLLAL
jgi:hypothetical protein